MAAEEAMRLELATGGELRRVELCQGKAALIWPELATAPGDQATAPPPAPSRGQARPGDLPSGVPRKVGRKASAANDPTAIQVHQRKEC